MLLKESEKNVKDAFTDVFSMEFNNINTLFAKFKN